MNPSSAYAIRSDCFLRSAGGKHLLMVFPSQGEPYSLEVNESFARLVEAARDLGSFNKGDLAAMLQREYDLSPEDAALESVATISLWKQYDLLYP